MNRKKIGIMLVTIGLIVAAAGMIELLSGFDSTLVGSPVSSSSSEPVPTADVIPETKAFDGVYESPDAITINLNHQGESAPDAPLFHTITRIEARSTKNMKDDAPADALLVELKEVPDRDFTVIVLVETDRPPIADIPENIDGLQLLLTYSNKQFVKSARQVGATGITDASTDHFNVRYQGFGDRAEVEFYGSLGTRYYAVWVTDGTTASFIVP